jgi:hypothetical protein
MRCAGRIGRPVRKDRAIAAQASVHLSHCPGPLAPGTRDSRDADNLGTSLRCTIRGLGAQTMCRNHMSGDPHCHRQLLQSIDFIPQI